jgi:uncharacterized cupredoxin-like copper-binding protein
MRKLIIGAALLVVAALAVPIALGAAAGTNVAVQLKEFKLTPKPVSTKAGKVTFTVKNVGKLEHEMVVLKTNVPAGKLPVNANGRVSERSSVGEAGEISPGQTKKVTLALKPGKYVLLCNIAGHYKAGQYAGFVVK